MSLFRWTTSSLVAVLALVCLSPVVAQADDWSGTMTTADGWTVVQNPATPILPAETYAPKEIWRLGGYSDVEEEFFGVISDVFVADNGDFYLLDMQLAEVKVFGADGSFVRTIGREGEGPGEFRRPMGMLMFPDGRFGVIQPFPSKIVLFDREGNPDGEFTFEPKGEGFASLTAARPMGDDLALVYNVGNPGKGAFSSTSTLAVVGTDGTLRRDMISHSSKMDYANSLCVETEWNGFQGAWSANTAGRVAARPDFTSYEIDVWNPDGTPDRRIRREYAPHKRTGKDIERIKSNWSRGIARWVPNPTFEIEENWNPVQDVFVRRDGSIWVRTSRGARDLKPGVMAEFDVFDTEGRYARKVILEGNFDPENDGMYLKDDFVVVVTDLVSARQALGGGGDEEEMDAGDEAEPMTVICYKLPEVNLASR